MNLSTQMRPDQYISIQREDEEKADQPLEQVPPKKQTLFTKLDLFLLLIVLLAISFQYFQTKKNEAITEQMRKIFMKSVEKAQIMIRLGEEEKNLCELKDVLFLKPFKQKKQESIPQPSEDRVQKVLENARKQLIQREKEIEKNVIAQNQHGTINPSSPTHYQRVAGIDTPMVMRAQSFVKLKNLPKQHFLADEERQYYEEKYSISNYEELPFCVVVPTYNNENNDRYKSNLDSILQQQYMNYHVVVIEDASKDRTGELIDQYIAKRKVEEKIKVIHNPEQMKALPNIRRAGFQFCKPEQIMMIVDGDDELVGRQIFKLFNAVFQEKKVWFMYTNFISAYGNIGYSKPFKESTIEKNQYRKVAFMTSHLRAFYTKLLTLVKEEDLKDQNGDYFRAANDVAICIPILEMSHKRVIYIPQISYLYNSNTGFNNHRVRLKEQAGNNKKIRKFQKYEALENLL